MATIRPGTILELEITGLDTDGNGTIDEAGTRLKIPGAAPGDAVRVRVEHVSRHRNEAQAILVDVIGRGENYAEPVCPMSIQRGKSCGGCPAIHLTVDAALEMKRTSVSDALLRRDIRIPVAIHASTQTTGYRNRSNYVVSRGRTGRPFLGSYKPHSHQVARMDGCRVLRTPIPQVADEIAYVLHLCDVPIYPEKSALRYVTLRASQQGRVLVDLVIGDKNALWLSDLATALMRIREIEGVSYSVNTDEGNALRVARSTQLCGDTTVQEHVGNVVFPLMAESFSQLNSGVAGDMYLAAASAVRDTEVLWDLYCGAGGLGLNALQMTPSLQLFGADSIEGTLHLARLASKHVPGVARFDIADLAERIPDWPAPDAVMVNPPRRGLDAVVRNALCAMPSATLLVYMSCNPESFAKDAAVVQQSGWKLESVDAWDMLPGTAHVELLGVFAKS